MLLNFLSKLEKVHRASSPEEREAIYRFRYDIYANELKRDSSAIDHAAKILRDDNDESDAAIHLYIGSLDNITASARLLLWPNPEMMTSVDRDMFSFDFFPQLSNYRCAEYNHLMMRPELRGKMVLPALFAESYDILVGTHHIDLLFMICVPGLVRYYKQLGARIYNARMVETVDGLRIPLMSVLSDADYFRAVGSPWYRQVLRYFGHGKQVPLNLSPLQDIFTDGQAPVEVDSERIWQTMQSDYLRAQDESNKFIEELPDSLLKILVDKGYMLHLLAGTLVVNKGRQEQEMFIVLDGLLEVLVNEQRINILEKGDLFGEVAFFNEDGERTAAVRALSECKILVIRRRFVDELRQRDPEAAHTLMMALGRTLSERLAKADARYLDLVG